MKKFTPGGMRIHSGKAKNKGPQRPKVSKAKQKFVDTYNYYMTKPELREDKND